MPHASPVSKLSGKTDIKMPHFQIIGKDNYRESVKLYFSTHRAISMTEEFLVLLQNKKKKERGRRLWWKQKFKVISAESEVTWFKPIIVTSRWGCRWGSLPVRLVNSPSTVSQMLFTLFSSVSKNLTEVISLSILEALETDLKKQPVVCERNWWKLRFGKNVDINRTVGNCEVQSSKILLNKVLKVKRWVNPLLSVSLFSFWRRLSSYLRISGFLPFIVLPYIVFMKFHIQ